jgi:hypothetical protein
MYHPPRGFLCSESSKIAISAAPSRAEDRRAEAHGEPKLATRTFLPFTDCLP